VGVGLGEMWILYHSSVPAQLFFSADRRTLITTTILLHTEQKCAGWESDILSVSESCVTSLEMERTPSSRPLQEIGLNPAGATSGTALRCKWMALSTLRQGWPSRKGRRAMAAIKQQEQTTFPVLRSWSLSLRCRQIPERLLPIN
jgi:hypothetical protein